MPPPTWQVRWRQIQRTRSRFSPTPFAASRSMTWTTGAEREPRQPAVEVVAGICQPFTLLQLDDPAALQVDRWNQHERRCAARVARECRGRRDTPSATAPCRWRSGESTPRAPRRPARTKRPRRDDPGARAAGRDDGMLTLVLTAAVSSQSKPVRVPSRSMEVRRISPAPRASASCAQATASRATAVVQSG